MELSDGWSREQLERRFDEIAAYFEKGGQCLHLNCFDSKVLKEAQE